MKKFMGFLILLFLISGCTQYIPIENTTTTSSTTTSTTTTTTLKEPVKEQTSDSEQEAMEKRIEPFFLKLIKDYNVIGVYDGVSSEKGKYLSIWESWDGNKGPNREKQVLDAFTNAFETYPNGEYDIYQLMLTDNTSGLKETCTYAIDPLTVKKYISGNVDKEKILETEYCYDMEI